MEYWVPAVAGIIVAIIEAFAARDRKMAAKDREEAKVQRDKSEKRAQIRAQESMLSMKMNDACLQLCIVCSNALTDGHNNGNVERARKAAEDAQSEYNSFLQKIASQTITK